MLSGVVSGGFRMVMPTQVAGSTDGRAGARAPFLRMLSLVVLSFAMVLTLLSGHVEIDLLDHSDHETAEAMSATSDGDVVPPTCEVDSACSAFIVPLGLVPIRSSAFKAQPRIVRTGSLVPLGGPTVSLPPPRFRV